MIIASSHTHRPLRIIATHRVTTEPRNISLIARVEKYRATAGPVVGAD